MFADSRETHAVTGFEERVEAASIRVTKELVLCHTENTRYIHNRAFSLCISDFPLRIPTATARWLEVRPWISRHYHIKIPDRMFTRRSHR